MDKTYIFVAIAAIIVFFAFYALNLEIIILILGFLCLMAGLIGWCANGFVYKGKNENVKKISLILLEFGVVWLLMDHYSPVLRGYAID